MASDIEYPSRVMCPLIDEMLDAGGCLEVSDIARGWIKERNLDERFREKENWREICEHCENRKYADDET